MSRLPKILASTVLVTVISIWSVLQVTAEDIQLMPAELEALAESIDCHVYADHYRDPNIVAPPFLYGVLGGVTDRSAAFLCWKEENDEVNTLLVLAKFDNDFSPKAGEIREGYIVSQFTFEESYPTCGLMRWSTKDVEMASSLKLSTHEPYKGESARTSTWPIYAVRGSESCGVFYFYRDDWYFFPLN